MLGIGLVLLVVVFSVVAAILVVACVIVHRLAGWQWEALSQVPLPSVVVQASDKVVGGFLWVGERWVGAVPAYGGRWRLRGGRCGAGLDGAFGRPARFSQAKLALQGIAAGFGMFRR